ncbi:hypothetical protein LDENG_00078230 [Lucifuga dentata]|nr:hypothetical protein LDENG_00078230 [Lucifuga dentata]
MKMKTRLLLLLLLLCVQRSECVRCFAHFHQTSGQCEDELGEVDDEDDCCQNSHYGYQDTDGECHSCGPPVWSPWSPWLPCSVLCGEGVSQRNRKCFGLGECEAGNNVETKACSATCCDGQGWGSWLSWSSCSLSCGVGGVRRRERVCSSPAECRSACSGPSEQTDSCSTHTTCPVHGGWSSWSHWSQCSASCIVEKGSDVIVPTRVRHRSCTSPAPSSDTVPPGNSCPGDSSQVQKCSELPNCPVDGRWGAWSPPGLCSVSCGEGLQLSIRKCDNPAPKYGGHFCEGPSARSSVCQSPCPVDGSWSGWSSWSECSTSCISEGHASVWTRHRSCSNPAPSSSPPGRGCSGGDRQTENCSHLSHCPVDGGWGLWSSFSSCSVTCGIGLQLSGRKCDSPAPKHGGQPCAGAGSRRIICETNVHCPVDGVWSEWSSWSPCKYPFENRDIRCKHHGGSQIRERRCLYRAHNGSICDGHLLTDRRMCYDVNRCYFKGSWAGWSDWSLCSQSCGGNSNRFRERICEPDFSEYRPIGRPPTKPTFYGKPLADCGSLPEGEKKLESQPCLNVPACP